VTEYRWLRLFADHLERCRVGAGDVVAVLSESASRPLLVETMRHCDGNQSKAAATLGINRATLRKKLKQYGL